MENSMITAEIIPNSCEKKFLTWITMECHSEQFLESLKQAVASSRMCYRLRSHRFFAPASPRSTREKYNDWVGEKTAKFNKFILPIFSLNLSLTRASTGRLTDWKHWPGIVFSFTDTAARLLSKFEALFCWNWRLILGNVDKISFVIY